MKDNMVCEKENVRMQFETEIFSQFNDKWALLSAGSKERHNTMTISWGGMGTLWFKPVVTVYVKPCRHTCHYMNDNEYFTVSFYPEEYKKALMLMGSMSGRDTDKDAVSGLTVKDLGQAVTYEEAEVTLLCKKIYFQDMERPNMPKDVVGQHYTTEEPHRMFIGEVVEVIGK